MKIAVICDERGQILASAVCRAYLGSDKTPVDVRIHGERAQGHALRSAGHETRCHYVDAPSFIEDKPPHEHHHGLKRIHEEMYIHMDGDTPLLRAKSARKTS